MSKLEHIKIGLSSQTQVWHQQLDLPLLSKEMLTILDSQNGQAKIHLKGKLKD